MNYQKQNSKNSFKIVSGTAELDQDWLFLEVIKKFTLKL